MRLTNEHTTVEHADNVQVQILSPRYKPIDVFWLGLALASGVIVAAMLFASGLHIAAYVRSLATGIT